MWSFASLVLNLDALRQYGVQLDIYQSGKACLQQGNHRAILHYFRNHYYASGLALKEFLKSSLLEWREPKYAIFASQSINQIIAEIDCEVRVTSNLKVLAFVGTTTSTSGAVIVPDLSANPVAIKALTQFVAVIL